MRNLKRALSLGLTAAMISGLMVMGSSAAGDGLQRCGLRGRDL